jgi:lipopolysaccharide transport system permease protein
LIRRLWSYRDLLTSLIRRNYQLRYRQSFAGILWVVLPTLATLGAAVLVFDGVVNVETGDAPYAVHTLAGLVPWTFFATSVTFGIPSVVNEKVLVTRLAFPRAVLPLALVGVAVLDLIVSGTIFGIVVFVTGEGLPPTALWFPVLMAIELVLVAGIVLLGSAMNVFARDVKVAIPLFVQLWLFLTPVMYSLNEVPDHLRGFFMLNPMTYIVESFRRILVTGLNPNFELLAPAMIGAVVVFVVGSWYFHATEPRFADAI